MTIRSELLALKDAAPDGILFPRDVVRWAAEHKGSALNSALEWDNKRAADAYRLEQVRGLIRLYVMDGEVADRVVFLSIDRTTGGGYRSLSDVVERPDLRDILLQDALDELERVRQKYERVQELATVWREAEEVRKARGRKRRVREQPQSVPA